jgi:hypothetical protein
MIIPTTFVIAPELPRLNLHTMLQLRTFGSTIFTEMRGVMTSKEEIFASIIDFHMDPLHYIAMTSLLLFIYGQYKYMEGHDSITKKIQKIERFKMLKQMTSEIIFIAMIVFTKNVESVF